MTIRHHHQERLTRRPRAKRLDPVSLAVLFVAIVLVGLALVGIGVRGTEPWIVIPPLLLGCFAILGLNR